MPKITIPNRPIGPFPTVLVGAEVNGQPNYTTVGACGVVSLEPVLYVSLRNSHHSTAGVRENGFFTVNIPSSGLVQRADYCGLVSGRKADKSHVFDSFYDERGRAPMIRECPLNFLCKVTQTIPVSDFTLFLGEIVAAYASEDCLTDGKPDPGKIDPLIMMGNQYWALGRAVGTVFRSGAAYGKPADQAQAER